MGGCHPGNKYNTISIQQSLIALMLNDRTEECLKLMQNNPNIRYSQPVNIINDNLLHYACKKNNIDIVRLIMSREPQAANKQNNNKKYPVDLATNPQLISIFQTNKAQAQKIY